MIRPTIRPYQHNDGLPHANADRDDAQQQTDECSDARCIHTAAFQESSVFLR